MSFLDTKMKKNLLTVLLTLVGFGALAQTNINITNITSVASMTTNDTVLGLQSNKTTRFSVPALANVLNPLIGGSGGGGLSNVNVLGEFRIGITNAASLATDGNGKVVVGVSVTNLVWSYIVPNTNVVVVTGFTNIVDRKSVV